MESGRLETLLECTDGIVWEGDPATFRFTFVRAIDRCVRAGAAGKAHDSEYRMIGADGRVVVRPRGRRSEEVKR